MPGVSRKTPQAEEMKIIQRKTQELIPYARNSRKHSDSQINQVAASIKEFGFTNPVLIDSESGIIAGHCRVLAAMRLGIDYVPCVILDGLTEHQKRAYIIADNRIALNSEWDMDMLAIEIEELMDSDFDLDLLGFERNEIESIVDKKNVPIDEIQEADIPQLSERPNTRLGDVFNLGDHRLVCGSSTEAETFETLIQEMQPIRLMITDPPYNVNYEGKTSDKLKIDNDDMGDNEFSHFLNTVMKNALSVLDPGAAFYIFHADTEGFNFRQSIILNGEKIRQCLIWVKNSIVMGRQDYHWQHEPCLYGWKSGAAHTWNSDRKQSTILNFDRPQRSDEHPTMKPVALFSYLIKNSTYEGDVIIDPFLGSGTSLLAAETLKRKCLGIELSPGYCDVIIQRWQNLTGRLAYRNDGTPFNDLS